MPYRQIKAHAAATRANLSGGTKASANAAATTSSTSGVAAEEDARPTPPRQANGKKQKSRASANGAAAAGGNRSIANFIGASGARIVSEDDASMDPNEQLHDEMRRANRGEDEDVDMAD